MPNDANVPVYLTADHRYRPSLYLVCALTLVVFLPFLNRAFHIDDTLFLWVARHLAHHPLDFYGFDANWYGETMRMSDINQNPPLTAYYIALVRSVAGEREITLHLAFLLPAVLVIAASHRLAGRFCNHPAAAALLVLLSPVFLVSGGSVMSDVPMLAAYLWGLVLWCRSLERDSFPLALAAAACMGVAFLTKYFGITAVPLALVYALAARRGLHRNLWALLLPLAVVLAYRWYTTRLYGHDLFTGAAVYSVSFYERSLAQLGEKTIIGLAFTGGCLVAPLAGLCCFARHRTTTILLVVALLALLATGLFLVGRVGPLELHAAGKTTDWPGLAQLTLTVAAGLALLVLAGKDLLGRRDPAALLLAAWVAGTFLFTTYVNWTTNGRTVLPMAPAAAILVVRHLETTLRRRPAKVLGRVLAGIVLLTAAVALPVAAADASLANAQRRAAATIMARYGNGPGTVWFQGHWGFQYYMEKLGARAVDYGRDEMHPGDLLVIPRNNTNIRTPDRRRFLFVEKLTLTPMSWVTTMEAPPARAGFYSDIWGAMPYGFGRVNPEEYFIFRLVR